MNQWFYAQGGRQLGPVPASTIQQLIASGQLNPTDLVWREGMANWVAASTIPELSAVQAAAQSTTAAPKTSAATGTWYYAQGGRQLGPVPASTLQQMLGSGQLQPTDMVWREGMANWVAAKSVPELSSASAAAAPAGTSAAQEWHYARGGQQKGPVSIDALNQLAASGQLSAGDLVWKEGMANWVPAQNVPGLSFAQGAAGQYANTLDYVSAPLSVDAKAAVQAPAIAMLVMAILGLVVQAVAIPINLIAMSQRQGMRASQQPLPPIFASPMFNGGMSVVFGVIGIAVGLVILFAAIKMRKLQSYGFVMTGVILAMLPCVSPCCLLGLPFGIWSLVVLMKPEVKAAFT